MACKKVLSVNTNNDIFKDPNKLNSYENDILMTMVRFSSET